MGEENLEHFLLGCHTLSDARATIPELQQPYEENREKVITVFLFDQSTQNMERKKEELYKLWKMRMKKLREME